ncbi:MAG: hypothetical protein ACTHN0_16620 [Aquihabitans sp.]
MKQRTRSRSAVRRADRRRNRTADPAVAAELALIAEVRRDRSDPVR